MFEFFMGINLLILFFGLGFVILWIWALIEIITSKFKEDLMQIIWLLVVFFLPFLGLLLYLLIGRGMRRDTTQGGDNRYENLAKLKTLLDDGVITAEEFETEKQKILNTKN